MTNQAEFSAKDIAEYRELLYELIVGYLTKTPTDFQDFALRFFIEKKENRLADLSIARDAILVKSIWAEGSFIYSGSYEPAETNDFPKRKPVKMKIYNLIKDMFPFKYLHENQMTEILNAIRKIEVGIGELIVREGDEGDSFYLIEDGYFKIFTGDELRPKLERNYEKEGSFGDMCLIYNEILSFSVKALSDGELWTIDRKTYKELIIRSDIQRRNLLKTYINNAELFYSLTDTQRMSLIDILETKHYIESEYIYRTGDDGDGIYFILEGAVNISLTSAVNTLRKSTLMKVLTKGDCFGEVSRNPRLANAQSAKKYTSLAYLNIDAFERLCSMDKNDPAWNPDFILH